MKTILLTGATGGLGHAVVERLSRDYRAVAFYRSESSWQRLREAIPAVEGITTLDQLGPFSPFHAFVHLAGGFAAGSSREDFAAMFESNVLSAVSAFAAVAPHLATGGRIVAISSAASLTHPAGLAAYTSSKAALNAFVQTLAKDLAARRITANAILPTALATPVMRDSAPAESLVPLERVAEWIAFLLSDSGSGVTGQLITLSASS
jgi:NAD(P)-dependent dehydrogenase (short-subunit alcohol dehydrogenase family)